MRSRSHFWRLGATIAAAATVLAMLWLPASARAQSSDSLSASPTSGPTGTVVTLKGAGFTAYPGDPVEIDINIDHGNGNWDLLVRGAANPVPDANGNFTTTVTIPANAPTGDLLAISTISEPEADAFFTVTGTPSTGPVTSAPAAPSNLTAKAVDQHDITLSWQDNSGNETGFQINNGVVSRSVQANTTTYTWGGLAPGTYMCFHVRADNSAGYSAWAPNVSPWYVCATTPKLKPKPVLTPTIYWSRVSGRPGTLVTVTGNGWAPGGIVEVQPSFKGFFIGISSWRVNSRGQWKESFTEGDVPPGKYQLSFSESARHLMVSGTFTIVEPPSTTARFLAWLKACISGQLSKIDPGCQEDALVELNLKISPTTVLGCAVDVAGKDLLGIASCVARFGTATGYGVYLLWQWWSAHHKPGP